MLVAPSNNLKAAVVSKLWVSFKLYEYGLSWFFEHASKWWHDRQWLTVYCIAQIWDLASGTLKLSLTGHVSTVRGVAVSPRQPYLFSAGEDKQVKCWDLEYNKVWCFSLLVSFITKLSQTLLLENLSHLNLQSHLYNNMIRVPSILGWTHKLTIHHSVIPASAELATTPVWTVPGILGSGV